MDFKLFNMCKILKTGLTQGNHLTMIVIFSESSKSRKASFDICRALVPGLPADNKILGCSSPLYKKVWYSWSFVSLGPYVLHSEIQATHLWLNPAESADAEPPNMEGQLYSCHTARRQGQIRFVIFKYTVPRGSCCSVAESFPNLSMDYNTPGFPVLGWSPCYLLEFAQTHIHWVSDAIQPSHPLSPLSPHALSLSQHQGLIYNESVLLIMWPTYWSFRFSISPSNEYSGLISFRIDGFDLLTVQGTLKSLLQCHSISKASILQHSTFSMVQLSHLYDYWKNHSFDYMDLCWKSDVSAF